MFSPLNLSFQSLLRYEEPADRIRMLFATAAESSKQNQGYYMLVPSDSLLPVTSALAESPLKEFDFFLELPERAMSTTKVSICFSF